MPALTPTSKTQLSDGNLRMELAVFSAINNADYWDSGIGALKGVFPVNGQSGQTFGVTISGQRATFAASAALANVIVLAVGVG